LGTSTITGEFGFLGFLLAFLLLVFFFFPTPPIFFSPLLHCVLPVSIFFSFSVNFYGIYLSLFLFSEGRADEGKVDFVT